MATTGEIEVNPRATLGHALAEGFWHVPRYQREYKWEEKHIQDLFDDVENALDEKQDEYFLGSIVVTKASSDHPEIVDGQQRLATTAILLSAIRDYFDEKHDGETARQIEAKYLIQKDIRSKQITPKLSLNQADHQFFEEMILRPASARGILNPTRESHQRLLVAQKMAKEYLVKITKNKGNPDDRVHDRIDFFEKKARVIWVAVPEASNAFLIFETLNDRGIELAMSDLIKNYLFGRSGVRVDEVQQRWIVMHSTIESVADEKTVVDYIRHQWCSRNGLTRERELFGILKADITNANGALGYATLLADDSKIYAALLNPTQEFWNVYGPSTRQHMEVIELLGMERVRPLLLSVLREFLPKEARKVIKVLVSCGVRFLVSGSSAGTLERAYSDRASDIANRTITTAKGLILKLKPLIPTDSDFEAAFATARVTKSDIARYYLRAIERQMAGENEPELVPNENTDQINLEHILPRNPAPSTWKAFKVEELPQHTNKLGNLALMQSSQNLVAGNEIFKDKIKRYQASKFMTTSSISALADWTPQSISTRQKDLAKQAVATWSVKI
jgi:hypothetical protein